MHTTHQWLNALEQVKSLESHELEEFLQSLGEMGCEDHDEWDRRMLADFGPGGRLEWLLNKARAYVAAGKGMPLNERFNRS